MDDIVDLVLSNDFVIAFEVCHIELFVPAGEIYLLIADISCNHIFLPNNVAQSVYERDANLTFATGNEYFSTILYKKNMNLESPLNFILTRA